MIVSKLNTLRQHYRIARMFEVVGDVRQIGAAWFEFCDVFKSAVQPEMRRVLFEAQAIEHERVQAAQATHSRWRNLAQVCGVCKIVEAISDHGQATVNYFERRHL